MDVVTGLYQSWQTEWQAKSGRLQVLQVNAEFTPANDVLTVCVSQQVHVLWCKYYIPTASVHHEQFGGAVPLLYHTKILWFELWSMIQSLLRQVCDCFLTFKTNSAFLTGVAWFIVLLSCADPRSVDWPFVRSPIPMLAWLTAYLGFVWLGPIWMKNRKPFDLRYVMYGYNLLLVVLSGYMFFEVWLTEIEPWSVWIGWIRLDCRNYQCVCFLSVLGDIHTCPQFFFLMLVWAICCIWSKKYILLL